jgi:hypothetical protein
VSYNNNHCQDSELQQRPDIMHKVDVSRSVSASLAYLDLEVTRQQNMAQPRRSHDTATTQPRRSHNAATTQPRRSQDGTQPIRSQFETQQRRSHDAAKTQPRRSQDAAMMQPRYSQDAATTQPRRSQDAAKTQRRRSQYAATTQPRLRAESPAQVPPAVPAQALQCRTIIHRIQSCQVEE